MNAQQLQHPDGTKRPFWECGKCARVWSEHEPYMSEKCCACDCGVVKKGITGECDACHDKRVSINDADRLDNAVAVPAYKGPVTDGDGNYWPDLEEFCGHHEDVLEGDLPKFLYCCDIMPIQLDADHILQNLEENIGFEDPYKFDGVKEFHAAVDAFNKANEKNVYWEADYKHKTPVSDSDWFKLALTTDCLKEDTEIGSVVEIRKELIHASANPEDERESFQYQLIRKDSGNWVLSNGLYLHPSMWPIVLVIRNGPEVNP